MVIARNVLLFLRLWVFVYIQEKLKRFSGISAVNGHIQSCIPIYTVLLMDYAVKAVVGSFRELGKVVRLIRNKSLLGDSS